MSRTWHSYKKPPKHRTLVWLRLGDDGEREAVGFYSAAFSSYFEGKIGDNAYNAVHPTHWAEIEEDDT